MFPSKTAEKEYNPKLLAKASKLWNEGLSLRAIGKVVGRTQPTVGRIVRKFPELFQPRDPIARAAPIAQPAPKKQPKLFVESAPDLDWVPPIDGKTYDADRLQHGKTLLDVGSSECKWPLNAGGPFLFCADTAVGGNYCAHHRMRSVRAA
ncbi:GcrA family cell cycle regulator [Neorhizobium sp. P12A]|uniref:GcrA family cell cycle regulator n=1 Tax=Neorhizobium sp. P12A TaxID=2268027 RepID=UPI002484B223|nr:GcrA family cell cycle regulator [Neorhizobium sp. P12A]